MTNQLHTLHSRALFSRLQYINLSPGPGVANLVSPHTVQAFIGTPPQWRKRSRLCWKQGPCLMFEDIASSSLATEWIKGKSVDTAAKIKNSDIAKELSLPPVKLHCSSE